MFSKACEVAKGFTRPVIISQRLANGTVSCGIASFIVVNPEGWIVTAAHVIEPMRTLQIHQAEKGEYEAKLESIRQNPSLSPSQRKRQTANLKRNPEWLLHQSHWWAMQPKALSPAFHVDGLADVAIGKLEQFDTSGIQNFPVFKDPATDPLPGTSLCRLGFPFHDLQATFDDASGNFTIQNFSPPPMFPNDGIQTRLVRIPDAANARTAKFIETSTPGLRGQSGGPLFDVRGEVWGIQSKTAFLELGFIPKKKDGNREIVEHQFMNVGWAAHISQVIDLFKQHGVSYQSA
jgi:hypothetical protein